MGKKIVIEGADFSKNGIFTGTSTLVWYIQENDELQSDTRIYIGCNPQSAGWSFPDSVNALIQGKTINCIKLRPYTSGTLNLYVTSDLGSIGSLVAAINIATEDIGVDTMYNFSDVSILSGQYLVIGESGLSGGGNFYYANTSDFPNYGFYRKVGTPEYNLFDGTSSLFINIGYRG